MGKASLEASSGVVISYSGLYNLMLSVGFVSGHQCYSATIILLLVAALLLVLGKFHLQYWDLLILSFSYLDLVVDGTLSCRQSLPLEVALLDMLHNQLTVAPCPTR